MDDVLHYGPEVRAQRMAVTSTTEDPELVTCDLCRGEIAKKSGEKMAVVRPISGKKQGITEITEAVDKAVETYQVGNIRMLIILKGSVKEELFQLRSAQAYISRMIERLEKQE